MKWCGAFPEVSVVTGAVNSGDEDVIVVNVFFQKKSIELVSRWLQSSETGESGLGQHDVCGSEEDGEPKVTDQTQKIKFHILPDVTISVTWTRKRQSKGRVWEKWWRLKCLDGCMFFTEEFRQVLDCQHCVLPEDCAYHWECDETLRKEYLMCHQWKVDKQT